MVAYITPNRMRDEGLAALDESRLSDIDQIRNNIRYAIEYFKRTHSEITGAHSTTRPISVAMSVPAGTTITVNNTPNAFGFHTFFTGDNPDLGVAPDELTFAICCGKGSGGSPGYMEAFLYLGSSSSNSYILRAGLMRRSATAGTSAQVLYGYTTDPDEISGTAETRSIPLRMVLDSRFPLCANHYDDAYEGVEIFISAFDYRHESDGDPLFELLEMKGTELVLVGQKDFGNIQGDMTTHLVAAHGGAYVALVPSAAGVGDSPIQQHAILPAWDDTSSYLVSWVISPADEQVGKAYFAAITVPMTNPTLAPVSPQHSDTLAKAQGYPTEPAEWEEVQDNLDHLRALLAAEHNLPSGAHQFPWNNLTGWTEVKSAWAVTADTTVGNITETLIESEPGDVLYLVALVGAAGSGIVAATISRNGTDAYLVLRRITAGSTNSFTATIWRFTRA